MLDYRDAHNAQEAVDEITREMEDIREQLIDPHQNNMTRNQRTRLHDILHLKELQRQQALNNKERELNQQNDSTYNCLVM